MLEMAAGGHRIQRVPPSEKRGRVHTSTVTVAVIDPVINTTEVYSDDQFRIEWFSGTGKGGQKRNKSQSCCRVIHIPTGITESRQGRSRDKNYNDAKAAIIVKLNDSVKSESTAHTASIRKRQVGSGMRADKTVTIRFQDDTAKHHITGKSMSAKKFMRGGMDKLWE